MNGPLSPDVLLSCALEAARAGGGHAMANLGRRRKYISVARHDVKLELDVECQKIIEKTILSRHPGHSILGEEDTGLESAGARAPYEWVVDPIDGTVNFYHGMPFWCCCVAVRSGGKVLAGAVYAPEMGEIYSAAEGGPATCNGRPIRVSGTRTVAESLITTGLDKSEKPGSRQHAFFDAITLACRRSRVLGSAALDMIRVALGQADGYFEAGVYIWDVAAASIIVERAGGKAELIGEAGGGRIRYLATNGLIHEELAALLKRVQDGHGQTRTDTDKHG